MWFDTMIRGSDYREMEEAGLCQNYYEAFAKRMEMAGIKPHHRIAIGVSGGPDSMALCILASHWKRAALHANTRTDDYIDGLVGLVVDHGLRAESAAEATCVQNWVSTLDKLKGSFYANPIVDVPTIDESLIQRYPSYCHPNLWPKNDLPELEFAFKDLGKLILDVGLLLAYHCDKYVSKRNPNHEVQSLEQMLRRSLCHKGRLLHYFPPALSKHDQSVEGSSSWCGWHTDHSSLTGLTCAMYLKGGSSITCPDKTAGLYVKTHTGAIVKVVFGENQIAYQLGEATEILSRGLFHATPHCVMAAKGDQASGVERDTFALFMQPHWDEPLNVSDPSAYPYEELVKSNGNITFGDFSEQLLSKYYGL